MVVTSPVHGLVHCPVQSPEFRFVVSQIVASLLVLLLGASASVPGTYVHTCTVLRCFHLYVVWYTQCAEFKFSTSWFEFCCVRTVNARFPVYEPLDAPFHQTSLIWIRHISFIPPFRDYMYLLSPFGTMRDEKQTLVFLDQDPSQCPVPTLQVPPQLSYMQPQHVVQIAVHWHTASQSMDTWNVAVGETEFKTSHTHTLLSLWRGKQN